MRRALIFCAPRAGDAGRGTQAGVIVRAAVRQKKTGRAGRAACLRRAASSKPALWPLIIVPIVLPRIVVLAAAPERIVETPATPAEAEVVTAHDADIGRARAVDDAALRLVVQRNDELRAVIGLAVQRLVTIAGGAQAVDWSVVH